MNVISWLIIGALVGWAVSAAMHIKTHEQIYLNAALGSATAALSGWFISPIVGVPAIEYGSLSIGAALVALTGAMIAVFVNALQRGSERARV
jgi:uncharacterized membrane protein YeaQ/YmgE (transglycosylase-associated protein family)